MTNAERFWLAGFALVLFATGASQAFAHSSPPIWVPLIGGAGELVIVVRVALRSGLN
jgi:hypothetical protein